MKLFSVTLALALLLLTGCGQSQQQAAYIGADRAKQAALDAAGLDAAESMQTDMSARNGMDYYQVTFRAGGEDYQYDIDAITGAVIESRTPESASGPSEAAQPENTPAAGLSSDGAQAAAQNGEVAMLAEEEAKAKALAHAGLTAEQVKFVKSGLDWDDGHKIYDIEFYTEGGEEYDYDIDPYSGEVLNVDYDAEYYAPPASAASGASITADEAKALALAQVPGAALEDIREFETDYEEGRLEYEGAIYYNNMEYEFEIDGYSGAIRSWEVESIYD